MLAASFLGTRYNVGLECIWYSKGPRYLEGLDMACEETLSFRTPRRRGPSTPLPRLTLKARLMRSLETQPSPAIRSDPMMQIVFQLRCWLGMLCVWILHWQRGHQFEHIRIVKHHFACWPGACYSTLEARKALLPLHQLLEVSVACCFSTCSKRCNSSFWHFEANTQVLWWRSVALKRIFALVTMKTVGW